MARIRTIKPEFWQNEQLAAVSEHARLLAIALLNHADDGGYFLANASLVRSACFPFEDDSTRIRGSIDELSQIGYIEIRSGSGKEVGRVCKFSLHQRIDKPQPSKLEEAFNAETPEITTPQERSESLPGTFPEPSEKTTRLEQGTGNREREQGTGEKEQGETANAETLTVPKPAPDSKAKRPKPPTVDEIADYCRERQNDIDPEAFHDYYAANGWKQSNGNPIKDWRAAVRTWEKNDGRFGSRGSPPKTFATQRLENNRQALAEFINE